MDRMNRAQLDLFLNGEDEEVQGPLPEIAQIFQVERHADGSASAVELVPDRAGDLHPADVPREFTSMEAALAFTGHTGARTDGSLVAVICDGRLV
jgi:hypothetical protein